MSLASPSAPYLPGLVVVGPIATGKSALALDLVERMHSDEPTTRAEIINADASLLYRSMDIGTVKPSPVERARALRHQIDALTVRDGASVAAFQHGARGDIDAVESQGHLPIIVGGSSLCVRALTNDLDFPGIDPAMYSRLNERAERGGAAALHAELARLDPVAVERAGTSNTRRIVQTLEVIKITGCPFPTSLPRYEDVAPTIHIALRYERRLLDKRINERAHAMFDGSLVEEVEALIDQGILEGEIAPYAIGYTRALAIIDRTVGVSEAVDFTALTTHQLTSRQVEWFRRDPWLHWIDVALTEARQCTGSEHSQLTRQA